MDKRILTIQDISCFGQCSLTVALPIISACGFETSIVPSAVLSTHTGGFKDFTFRDLSGDMDAIRQHWVKQGIEFDAFYTGYLGTLEQIEEIKAYKQSVVKPEGLMIVDPAMADDGMLYPGFDQAYVEGMKSLLPISDVILPNITEACFLTGVEYIKDNHTQEYIQSLIEGLRELGATTIILKGVLDKPGYIGNWVITDTIETYYDEKLDRSSHGTGDCFASVFTGAVVYGKSMLEATTLAAQFVKKAIEVTSLDENHWYGVKFEKVIPFLIESLKEV